MNVRKTGAVPSQLPSIIFHFILSREYNLTISSDTVYAHTQALDSHNNKKTTCYISQHFYSSLIRQ